MSVDQELPFLTFEDARQCSGTLTEGTVDRESFRGGYKTQHKSAPLGH